MERVRSQVWQLPRTPALDGVRAVAIILVLLCHTLIIDNHAETTPQWHAVGFAGLTMFFTLSGFLITTILLTRPTDKRWEELAHFYWNRLLRLLPALVVVVVACLGLSRLTGISLVPSWLPVLGYAANWAELSGGHLGVLQPTWTLSIEEQFYLLWPLALLLAMRWRRGPGVVALGGALISVALRLSYVGSDPARVYYGSAMEASSLLFGCLLAIFLAGGGRGPRVSGAVAASLAAVQLAWLLVRDPLTADVLVPLLVPLSTCLIILAALQGPVRILDWPALGYLGRRSYGIYLWHYAALWMVKVVLGPRYLAGALGLALALLAAESSWRLVERPLQRLRWNGPAIDAVVRRPEGAAVPNSF